MSAKITKVHIYIDNCVYKKCVRSKIEIREFEYTKGQEN